MPQPSRIYEFDALGTHWWIEPLKNYEISSDLRYQISNIIHDFEDNYSRFNNNSLVGRLNQNKVLTNPPKEMVQMLNYAKKTFNDTDGVFNISIGGLLNKFGYGDINQSAQINHDIWKQTIIDDSQIIIPESTIIDFGGFGKGWLIDKINDLLNASGVGEYIVNGGGDMYVNSTVAIELGLEHPYDQSKLIGTTKITKGALAVSSIVKRRWYVGQQLHHHIINPTTQQSSNNDIVASYIKAKTALAADTMATCLIVRPEMQAELSNKFDLKVILLTKNQLSESE